MHSHLCVPANRTSLQISTLWSNCTPSRINWRMIPTEEWCNRHQWTVWVHPHPHPPRPAHLTPTRKRRHQLALPLPFHVTIVVLAFCRVTWNTRAPAMNWTASVCSRVTTYWDQLLVWVRILALTRNSIGGRQMNRNEPGPSFRSINND